MTSLLSFELTKSTSFFAIPGKSSNRQLMDGFNNTSKHTEEEDKPKSRDDGDRDIPGQKPESTVKDKL